MELFDFDSQLNLLPYDGVVNYYGIILSHEQSCYYFDQLLKTVEWKPDCVVINGQRIITTRKIAWYGDKNYRYTYSNTSKQALAWTPLLLEIKAFIEQKAGVTFNACLINLYHDGHEGVSWHSDDEPALDSQASIASLSLGVERKFSFKHKKNKETVSIRLQVGSLLIMKGNTQKYWLHALPKTSTVSEPRINLTFRVMR